MTIQDPEGQSLVCRSRYTTPPQKLAVRMGFEPMVCAVTGHRGLQTPLTDRIQSLAGEERFELPSQRFGGVHNARYTIPPRNWCPLMESNHRGLGVGQKVYH